jgi:hypothetical protein
MAAAKKAQGEISKGLRGWGAVEDDQQVKLSGLRALAVRAKDIKIPKKGAKVSDSKKAELAALHVAQVKLVKDLDEEIARVAGIIKSAAKKAAAELEIKKAEDELKKYAVKKGFSDAEAITFMEHFKAEGTRPAAAKVKLGRWARNIAAIKKSEKAFTKANDGLKDLGVDGDQTLSENLGAAIGAHDDPKVLKRAKPHIVAALRRGSQIKIPKTSAPLPPAVAGNDWNARFVKLAATKKEFSDQRKSFPQTIDVRIALLKAAKVTGGVSLPEPSVAEPEPVVAPEPAPPAEPAPAPEVVPPKDGAGPEYKVATLSNEVKEWLGPLMDGIMTGIATKDPTLFKKVDTNGDIRVSEDEMIRYQLVHGDGIDIGGFKISLKLEDPYRQNVLDKIADLQGAHNVTAGDLAILSNPTAYASDVVQARKGKLDSAKAFAADLFKWLGGTDGFGIWLKNEGVTGWKQEITKEYGDVNNIIANSEGACSEKTSVIVAAFALAGIRTNPILVYDLKDGMLSIPTEDHISAGVKWAGSSSETSYDANIGAFPPKYKKTAPIDTKKYLAVVMGNRAAELVGKRLTIYSAKGEYKPAGDFKEGRRLVEKALKLFPQSEQMHLKMAAIYRMIASSASAAKNWKDELKYRNLAIEHYCQVAKLMGVKKPGVERPLVYSANRFKKIKNGLVESVGRYIRLVARDKDQVAKLNALSGLIVNSCGGATKIMTPIVLRLAGLKASGDVARMVNELRGSHLSELRRLKQELRKVESASMSDARRRPQQKRLGDKIISASRNMAHMYERLSKAARAQGDKKRDLAFRLAALNCYYTISNVLKLNEPVKKEQPSYKVETERLVVSGMNKIALRCVRLMRGKPDEKEALEGLAVKTIRKHGVDYKILGPVIKRLRKLNAGIELAKIRRNADDKLKSGLELYRLKRGSLAHEDMNKPANIKLAKKYDQVIKYYETRLIKLESLIPSQSNDSVAAR